jgi:hypothetical protein
LAQGLVNGFKADGANVSTSTQQGVAPVNTGITEISIPYAYNSDGTVNLTVSIVPDNSSNPPTSYKIVVTPSNVNQYGGLQSQTYNPLISQMSKDGNGNYVYVMGSPTGFASGVQYQVAIYAVNSNGTSSGEVYTTEGIIPLQSSPSAAGVTNVSASGNMTVTWTGATVYDGYIINYASGYQQIAFGISLASSWKQNSLEPTPMTTDKINFTDNYSAQNYFTAGSVVNITITPYSNGSAGPSGTYTYTIPAQTSTSGGNTAQIPTPQVIPVYAQNYHEDPSGNTVHGTGGSFYWFDNPPTGDYESYYYEWEFKHGSGSFGSINQLYSPNINPPYGEGYYYVTTGDTGSCTLQVRQTVVDTNGTAWPGQWTSATGTFT